MGTDRSKVKSILPFLDIVLHLAAAAVKLKYLIRLQIFHGRNYECEHVDHLTIRLLNLEDYSSGMRPAAGLIHEFAVLCSVINLIFDGCMIQCVIGKSRILYQCRVQLQTNCIFAVVFLTGFIDVGRSKTAVTAKVKRQRRILYTIFLKKRDHELVCIPAAVFGSFTKFCFQKVTGQTIKAEQRMIAMCLIMDVKTFPFLTAIGIQQGRIQIKQHKFRLLDRIDDLPHCRVDLVELGKGIIIHSVPEAGQRRL